jgi:hypothetical protein
MSYIKLYKHLGLSTSGSKNRVVLFNKNRDSCISPKAQKEDEGTQIESQYQ